MVETERILGTLGMIWEYILGGMQRTTSYLEIVLRHTKVNIVAMINYVAWMDG